MNKKQKELMREATAFMLAFGGYSLLEHNNLIIMEGRAFLYGKIEAPLLMATVEESPIFWKWWRYKWMARDIGLFDNILKWDFELGAFTIWGEEEYVIYNAAQFKNIYQDLHANHRTNIRPSEFDKILKMVLETGSHYSRPIPLVSVTESPTRAPFFQTLFNNLLNII